MITPANFIYAGNFPSLLSADIQTGIDAVNGAYSGALQCWAALPDPDRANKRTLLENLLTGWWLANMFPGKVIGIESSAGLPLSGKSAGGLSLSIMTVPVTDPALVGWQSNSFGRQALMLFLGCPERSAVYG